MSRYMLYYNFHTWEYIGYSTVPYNPEGVNFYLWSTIDFADGAD